MAVLRIQRTALMQQNSEDAVARSIPPTDLTTQGIEPNPSVHICSARAESKSDANLSHFFSGPAENAVRALFLHQNGAITEKSIAAPIDDGLSKVGEIVQCSRFYSNLEIQMN